MMGGKGKVSNPQNALRERVGVVVVVVANLICCDVDPKVVFELLAVFTGCSPNATCYDIL